MVVSKLSAQAPQIQHQFIISALTMSIRHQNGDQTEFVTIEKPSRINQSNVIFWIPLPTPSIKLSFVLRKGSGRNAQMDMLNTPGNLWRTAILGIQTKVVRKIITQCLLVATEILNQHLKQSRMRCL